MPISASPFDELRHQLAELEHRMQQGGLSREAASAASAALKPLLADTRTTGARPSRALLIGLAAFVLAFGAVGYAWRGNPEGLRTAPGIAADAAPGHSSDAQIEAMLARLEARLKAHPDDAEGWSMLARSHTVRGRFAEALPAYQRVVELQPRSAQALADYADALATVSQHALNGEPERLIRQALALDGSNAKALSLAGTIAFDRADFAAAAADWAQALQTLDPASEMARQLQSALDEARERAGIAPPSPAPAAEPAAISGRVDIAPELKARMNPEDTLFIFARAPTGAKMPLAILRKKAGDLPLSFTLDDSMAMNPAARLSSVRQLVVGARISRSGDAIAHSGDLQGLSATVPLGTQGLQITIAEAVK